MSPHREHCLLIEPNTRRICALGLASDFVPPQAIIVLRDEGVQTFLASQLLATRWRGAIPPGCTPQTCFRFALDDEHHCIRELDSRRLD